MKKTITLLIVLFITNTIINAQIKISSSGNVAIETSPTPNDYTKTRIYLSTLSHDGVYWNFAAIGHNNPSAPQYSNDGRYNVGVYGLSYYSSAQTTGQMYGIFGQAGNATTGYNYGVFGRLIGSNNGAGLFGAMNGRGVANTGGNYAGYFNGCVGITDNLYVDGTIYEISDQKLKKNISSLTNNTFSKIFQLNAVSYNFKTRAELKAEGIIPTDTSSTVDVENENINNTHFGFIAQDVMQIFPELVVQRGDSILSIDYIGFIPLIIGTLNEQNVKINDLELQLAACCNSLNENPELKMGTNESNTSSEDSKSPKTARLYQNTPNPFTTKTQIKCYIPDNVKTAQLNIYNMQGTQLKKYPISRTGEIDVEISAYELTAGMYLYALIVDGKEIDVKRMILTD